MPRPSRVSPDRILAAAAVEFSARGFAGARVDRIARRARVNKAMLYYHFRSKQGLYRTLLKRTFDEAAARLDAIVADSAPADVKIEQVIETMARFMRDHAPVPAIMLREIAERGAHLDADTLAALASVPRAVAAVVQQGIRQKQFRSVHPGAVYFMMIAPIAVYLAGGPIREVISARRLADVSTLTPDMFVRHLQQSTRLALAAGRRRSP